MYRGEDGVSYWTGKSLTDWEEEDTKPGVEVILLYPDLEPQKVTRWDSFRYWLVRKLDRLISWVHP